MAFGNATKGYVRAHSSGGGGGGTSDYTELSNKPSINGVTLTGNKTSGELNISGFSITPVTVNDNSCTFNVNDVKAIILVGAYVNTYFNPPKYACNSIIVTPNELEANTLFTMVGDSGKYVNVKSAINQNQVTLSREYDGGMIFYKCYLIK